MVQGHFSIFCSDSYMVNFVSYLAVVVTSLRELSLPTLSSLLMNCWSTWALALTCYSSNVHVSPRVLTCLTHYTCILAAHTTALQIHISCLLL